jgi:hypothetical protein
VGDGDEEAETTEAEQQELAPLEDAERLSRIEELREQLDAGEVPENDG